MREYFSAKEHFDQWLVGGEHMGEAEYSVRKAPFQDKLTRAKNGQIQSFLGNEWLHAGQLREQGKHHSDQHEKTAQLQFAKFAAGLVDSVALIDWFKTGQLTDSDSQVHLAKFAAERFTQEQVPEAAFDTDPTVLLTAPFEDTLFYPGIIAFETTLSEISEGVQYGSDGRF